MIDVAGKRLLVLGANSETASFIVRAQERGAYVIVADTLMRWSPLLVENP